MAFNYKLLESGIMIPDDQVHGRYRLKSISNERA